VVGWVVVDGMWLVQKGTVGPAMPIRSARELKAAQRGLD
jgi:hypothetical protein